MARADLSSRSLSTRGGLRLAPVCLFGVSRRTGREPSSSRLPRAGTLPADRSFPMFAKTLPLRAPVYANGPGPTFSPCTGGSGRPDVAVARSRSARTEASLASGGWATATTACPAAAARTVPPPPENGQRRKLAESAFQRLRRCGPRVRGAPGQIASTAAPGAVRRPPMPASRPASSTAAAMRTARLMIPGVAIAITQITRQLELVRQEQPTWRNNECLREAKRRCAPAMVAACDAIEAKQARRRRPGRARRSRRWSISYGRPSARLRAPRADLRPYADALVDSGPTDSYWQSPSQRTALMISWDMIPAQSAVPAAFENLPVPPTFFQVPLSTVPTG